MITRFAPSPTGPLHLGHAYSAFLAHDMARAAGGQFLLRIEDIDHTRCRTAWEEQIYDDLTWLGITWDGPVMRPSERTEAYQTALTTLWEQGLLFECTCNRRDILHAASAPQEGAPPTYGPDGILYPGTCREKGANPGGAPLPSGVLRLNMAAATRVVGVDALTFTEMAYAPTGTVTFNDQVETVGDIVLSRRDYLGSYHLSVVLDDAAQGVTQVIRGEDLFEATKIHVILQRLLSLPTPTYHHHHLIRDDMGKRLAKRDDARAIAKYRAEGASPEDVRAMVGISSSY